GPSGDMITIAYRECDWCADRYGLHMALGFAAPGATVIVPTPSPYTKTRELREEINARLIVFGKVAAVHWVPYPDAAATAGAARASGGSDHNTHLVGPRAG